ncbi:MAG: ABC transporter ATP-binding protein [Acidobacteriota bacterium]
MTAHESVHDAGPSLDDGDLIVFDNVSKFYGEVLGVNRVTLRLEPGITGLVGPNGSGKSTLMNLMTGLLRPSEGSVQILGVSSDVPHALFDHVGYLTQFDAFPERMTGRSFIDSFLRVHGFGAADARRLTEAALERVNLVDAADRRMGGYSKGMRQRIRLAQAIAHEPGVLVLDEPLNGLDPMARSEVIEIFKGFADEGRHVVISSHVLHEVDMVSDRVVLLTGGYVVAEGEVSGVRSEVEERPIQVLVRCSRARFVAARLFEAEAVVQVELHDDEGGLLASTRKAPRFYDALSRLVLEHDIDVETVTVADSDVRAVYAYLIESEGDVQ